MRKLIQKIFNPILLWAAAKFSGAPKPAKVFKALSRMLPLNAENINNVLQLNLNIGSANFIIFSDQHKGNGDDADDFKKCENTYLAALAHYKNLNYTLVNLGDSEECWKFSLDEVIATYPKVWQAEADFNHTNKYIKIYGNHDSFWSNEGDVFKKISNFFKTFPTVYEGVVIKFNDINLKILITHGHQGDSLSEKNPRSKWIVKHIWKPLQRYLQLNLNIKPSQDIKLLNRHNNFMYQWACTQKNTILIAGHTHKPVFASGRYSTHKNNSISKKKQLHVFLPNYFNSGCCCYKTSSITGYEITNGHINLVKWYKKNGQPQRKVLEQNSLFGIYKDLGN